MSEPLTEKERADIRHIATPGSPVIRLLDEREALVAENARLKKDLDTEFAETIALMERLSEPAPSDEAAAERAVGVEMDGVGWRVLLQLAPSDFFVIHRPLTKGCADYVADAVRRQLASILAQHNAQIRAELTTACAALDKERCGREKAEKEREAMVAENARLVRLAVEHGVEVSGER